MRIALAADASKFADQVAQLLRPQSRELVLLREPVDALKTLRAAAPDLLVIIEPFFGAGLAGVLSRLRAEPALRPVPVLCVHTRASIEDGVASLDAGADDFINRPFNPQIFLARVRTLLRRRVWSGQLKEDEATSLQSGPIVVRLLQRQALINEELLALTRLEFDLLAHFLRNLDKVLRREEILNSVWNYPESVETRTLDKHVEMLRRKLGRHGPAIETVHGVGYRLAGFRKAAR